jgi:hypothetical protein
MKYNYSKPNRYVLYNHGDPDLSPICLRTPEPPEYKYIDGYGLPPVDQKFRYLETPQRLLNLEVKATDSVKRWADERADRRVTEYRVMNEFWRILDDEKASYQEEIEYIKRIHFYLYYGYWVFIHGVPTWLPPTYFRYLNFWYYPKVPGNRPFYRDVDRRTYIFKWYCRTTRETLGNLDEKGIARKVDGEYEVITCPTRTCFGHMKVKRRREGATNQECSDILWVAERTPAADCPIMADTGDSAESIYEDYMMVGWQHQPLFIKPINNTYSNSVEIRLVSPPQEYQVKSLGSVIWYVKTAGEGGVDRKRTDNILSDESAKLKRSDAYSRHEVSKPTAAQGQNIHGYMAYPSTVEEMEEGGGAYRDIWNDSNFYRRNPFNHTFSGMYRLFMPSYDGYDGYVDAWGNSVVDTPTPDQLKHAPPDAQYTIRKQGARKLLEDTVNQLLADGSTASQRKYREWIRKNPLKVSDCWIGTAGDLDFNTVGIAERKAVLNRTAGITKNFELRWIDNVRGNPKGVYAVDVPDGRFCISDLLLGRNNSWKWTPGAGIWDEKQGRRVRARMPMNPMQCTAGADPFDYGNKPGSRGESLKSQGGLYVMLNYDENIDGGKDTHEWQTDTTVCTYNYNPPSLEEFCDDVLKAAVFFQAMVVVERNKTRLWEYFIDMGFGGYLMYMVDPKTGEQFDKPGLFTGQGLGSKDEYFNALRDYSYSHVERERHIGLLDEMEAIQKPDQMRFYDLLTAAAVAFVGKRYGNQSMLKRISGSSTISLTGTKFSRRRY